MHDVAPVTGAPGVATRKPPRVGVVLAAGRSERLHRLTGGRSKLLLHLGGLPLIERAIRTLLAYQLDRIVVIVGHEGDAIAMAARRVAPGRVEVVRARDWTKGNGASLLAAEDTLRGEERFVVICSDHVFAPGALDGLIRAGGPAVLIDRSPETVAWQEGTRVHIEGHTALAFGKSLDDPAIDCGAFLLSPAIFPSGRQASAEGDDSLAGAVTRLAAATPVRAEPIPAGSWWQDVDTPEDLRRARRLLRRSLAKSSDGPVSHYLNRPISTRLSMALAPLRPSPNLLSWVAFVIGIVAASLLAAERPLIGGLLVHLHSLLDGVDGESARLQMRENSRGATLDNLLDRIVDAAIVAGLGWWVAYNWFSPRTILLLAAIGAAWGLLAQAGKERSTVLGLPPPTERLLGYLLGGRDGRLLLVTAWAVLGHPMVALVAFSVAWVATVVIRVFLVRRLGLESATTTA
jgi:1L-myo-inositol 1-phosphate cytidylyltransferase / CDP-L-myo-inositol myo-inositolphosphotransferase